MTIENLEDLPIHPHLNQVNNPKPVKGWRLLIPFTHSFMDQTERQLYWRRGISHEFHTWLLTQIGNTGTYVQWEEEDSQVRWLYTGTNQLSKVDQTRTGHTDMLSIRFREKSDAMLTKISWWDKV